MKHTTTSRELYKKIKRMNHNELDVYLSNVYANAYNNGVNDTTKTITDKIVAGLQNTKGIGEKRMTDILTNINKEITG